MCRGWPSPSRLSTRHPFSYVLAIGIELLGLQKRIKDPKIGLGVHACPVTEAPSLVVRCEVAVAETFHEVALAHAPVDQQVFGEEGGDDHAAAVVHPADSVELAHVGIDDGVAGAALTLGFEVLVVVLPLNVGVFGFENLFMLVKLATCINMELIIAHLTRHMASEPERAYRNHAKLPH
jgi:hypothetical protein